MTSSGWSRPPGDGAPHPLLACVETVSAAVTGVADVGPVYLSAGEKRAALLGLTGVLGQLEELRLRVLAAGESLGDVAAQDGSRDAAAWLAAHARLDTAHARRLARLAAALGRYGVLGAALRAGGVDVAQAEVIVAALDALPDHVTSEVKLLAEERLVVEAKVFAPRELRQLGKRILDVVAPDIAEAGEARRLAEEEANAARKTFLRFRRRGDGTTDIQGRLSDAVAMRLQRYLHAFTNPRRTHPGTQTDTQTDTGDDASDGGLGFEARSARTSPSGSPETSGTGSSNTGSPGSDSSGTDSCGTAGRAATSPSEERTSRPPQPGHPTPPTAGNGGDKRPYDQRMGEAFGAFLEAADPVPDAAARRGRHHRGRHHRPRHPARPARPRRGRAGRRRTPHRRPRPPPGLHRRPRARRPRRRVPVLDLGRTRRLFSPAQRKALAIRHPHCAAHGCDIPAPWCEAHHAGTPWAAGGRTDLADGVLLCTHHHHVAHDPRYDTTRHPDGSIRFHRRE